MPRNYHTDNDIREARLAFRIFALISGFFGFMTVFISVAMAMGEADKSSLLASVVVTVLTGILAGVHYAQQRSYEKLHSLRRPQRPQE